MKSERYSHERSRRPQNTNKRLVDHPRSDRRRSGLGVYLGGDAVTNRPKRIQMHRCKGGWRKDHPDAVIVARPSKWGNPFTVEDAIHIAQIKPEYARKFSVQCFGHWLRGDRQNWMGPESDAAAAKITDNLSELRGKDLACWCSLDQPCHADVLLEIANAPDHPKVAK